MSSQKRNRRRRRSTRAPSKQRRSSRPQSAFNPRNWKFIVLALIALTAVVGIGLFRAVSVTAMRLSEGEMVSLPRLAADTQVLAYVDGDGEHWQMMPFTQIFRGQEFQFDDRLCFVDQDGWVLVNRNVHVAKLVEADRRFEPGNWRWPEEEDVVRFVDEDHKHLRHDLMGTFEAGDRFWFQGRLYEGFADPNSPTGLSYRDTDFVLSRPGDTRVVDTLVELTLRGAEGNQFFISGDPEHLYFVPALNDYVAMGELEIGTTMRIDDGSSATVLNAEILHGEFTVYDPQPEGTHDSLASSASSSQGELYYFITDHQGSTVLVTDEEGNVVPGSRTGYYPFGDTRYGDTPTDIGFAGHRQDDSTGLIYMNGRYYHPKLGRFISPDTLVPNPSNPQSFNRYSYVYNNPLRYVDPSGHIPEVIYDPNTDTYTVKLNIQLYGPGAGETVEWYNWDTDTREQISVAEFYKRAIEETWNAGNPEYNGSKVVFEANVIEAEPSYPAPYNWSIFGFEFKVFWDSGIFAPSGGDFSNIIYVEEGSSAVEHPGVSPHIDSGRSFDWGSPWFAQMDKGVVVHESVHLFGIYEDRYGENLRPLPGYEAYISGNPNAGLISQPPQAEIDEIIDLAVDRGQVQILGGEGQ